MNPGQLQALFQEHKVGILGVAAAGAVLLGLRARKKTTGAGVGGGLPAGTLPAAAVVPANGLQATGSTYDSSAYDVYSALQSELVPFLQQEQTKQTTGQTGITSVPPVASTLFAPKATGNYVKMPNGVYAEVESDGTLFGITMDQWQGLQQKSPGAALTSIGGNVPFYSTEANLQTVAKKPAAGS